MEFKGIDRPVKKWPRFVKVNVWHDREDTKTSMQGDTATGEITISISPNDSESDSFAYVTARAASVHGAQIEATQLMATLGYEPAPGRIGRWHLAQNPVPRNTWEREDWDKDRIFQRR